ncbi:MULTISPECIES: HD domain-containing phosphohydrolase [unclassified Methylophaga]|jgi:putative two-component system response regulator|uniref:response regulator n=1 Tax=unclassified Methylophaga TaxID=2629249 RepID=UPI000C6209EB|nr:MULTISPECIES: HD domain-containing phosphohydrolase [unclassified Methylophaga]MAL48559.1 two-component system response regulator [Methylophaga sp.]MBP26486.1 two-component system response regulator [Methylophaga sp.]HCC80464.1 two-component system response regulator [Methylophaga sp.]|tara:strand:- start:5920 stop:6969 length:1050 start_codon:yes stop_codon:yes gene_type:complete
MDNSANVLIVDDVPDNIQVAMNFLKEEPYNLSFATRGQEALALMKTHEYDLILLDIMMPEMDGYEVCRRIKAEPRLQDIPIIFVTAKVDVDSISQGFHAGAVDYLCKPFHAEELLARVNTHLSLYRAKKLLQQNNLSLQHKYEQNQQRLMTELEQNQLEMIYVLTELMESTSDETGKHIRRVAECSRLLALYHESLTDEDADILFHAAPMHDICKITIPHSILHKPGKLTEDEFAIMKTHTTRAFKILHNSKRKYTKAAAIIAHQHHEKWDGSGYPQGLKGQDIHIYGRIVGLIDVFDALMHKRVYKEAWSLEDTLDYIRKHSSSQFDPYLVSILLEHIDEFVAISDQN